MLCSFVAQCSSLYHLLPTAFMIVINVIIIIIIIWCNYFERKVWPWIEWKENGRAAGFRSHVSMSILHMIYHRLGLGIMTWHYWNCLSVFPFLLIYIIIYRTKESFYLFLWAINRMLGKSMEYVSLRLSIYWNGSHFATFVFYS